MFYKKKVILLDLSGKIFAMLELTQNGTTVTVNARKEYNLAVFYKNEITHFCASTVNIPNYQGGEIHFGIIDNEKVVATGSTNGSHLPNLFTQENKKTKEKPNSLPVEKEIIKAENINNSQKVEQESKENLAQNSTLNPTENGKNCQNIETVEPKKVEKTRNVHEFYCSIKQNLDEMLTCYPREERLSALIEESSWVKVERSDGYYTVGLIKNDGAPEYICYGMPGKENDVPPDHLKDYCSWIPTDDIGNGYWTVFQDAKTGIAIKRN